MSVRDPFQRVWRSFEAHPGGWRPATAGFSRRDITIVDGARWTIIYKIHVIRNEGARMDRVALKSSITVWPTTRTRRRTAAALRVATEWCQKFEREVRKRGYRGRWVKRPGWHFGDFWRNLKGPGVVLDEVKLLDQIAVNLAAAPPR